MIRKRFVPIAVAAAVLGGAAVSTTPASANTSDGYISGTGDWTNDWSDEGPISASSYSYSNAAAGWQAILWADEYLTSTTEIDCRFGSTTTGATKQWQTDHLGSAYANGSAGPQTLARAESYMYANSSGQYIYPGRGGRYVTFTRNSSGQWGMYHGTSDHHLLSYTYANFLSC